MIKEAQGIAGLPGLDLAADVGVHAVQVAGQGRLLEGLLHDAAMELVVGEVTQHQPVGEQLFQEGVPGRAAGKHVLRILEDKLIGFRAQQGYAALKQYRALGHQAVFFRTLGHQLVVVLEEENGIAE